MSVWKMATLKCFCGSIEDSIANFVNHTVSTHIFENQETFNHLDFEIIQAENINDECYSASSKNSAKIMKNYENIKRRAKNLLQIKYNSLVEFPNSISKPVLDVLDTRSKHPLPEDLKTKIIEKNKDRGVEFTLSQGQFPKLVLDGIVMNKERGPKVDSQGS